MTKKTIGRTRIPYKVDCSKLRKLREEKFTYQSELARVIGYTPARVAQFETGTGGDIPFKVLKQIAELFEVDWEDLLIEEDNV